MNTCLRYICIFLLFTAMGVKSGALFADECLPCPPPDCCYPCDCIPCEEPVTLCPPPCPPPRAPICGTDCGLTYASMGLAVALVIGVAAIVLSGESAHSHD